MDLDKEVALATLFIGGLSLDTSEEDIELWAARYSHDYEVEIVRSKHKGVSAFVCLPDDIARNILLLPHYIKGRKIDCQMAIEKNHKASFTLNQKKRRIFVNNLPLNIGQKEINLALTKFGELRNFYTVKSRFKEINLCYAEFIHKKDAKRILREGLYIKNKKYLAYPYRTYTELNRNLETKNLIDHNCIKDSYFKGIAEKQTLSEVISYETPNNQGKELLEVDSCSYRLNTKPCLHSYFKERANRATSKSHDKPLFRLRIEAGNVSRYRKVEAYGTRIYVRTRSLTDVRGAQPGGPYPS